MNLQLEQGQKIAVHAYKHNGDLYRVWEQSLVLAVETDYVVLMNENVTITEINGRQWTTYDPAIWMFFPNKWYNIICMIRSDGIHYYCNIASPFIYEDSLIKYIDYDLDIKVFPNGFYRLLDVNEFYHNCHKWGYPNNLQSVLWKNFNILKKNLKKPQSFLFNDKLVLNYWNKFQNLSN